MPVTAAACLIAIGAVPASHAASPESGLYLGPGAGRASFDRDKGKLDDAMEAAYRNVGLSFVASSSDVDDSDTFTALIGYRVGKHFAAEAAYADLGTLDYRTTSGPRILPTVNTGVPTVVAIPVDPTIELAAKGTALSALGILPIGQRWDVFGRAGVFFADTKTKFGLATPFTVTASAFPASSTDSVLGIGAEINAGDHLSVRLEYQRFVDVGKETEVDVDVVGLTVLFRL